MLASVSCKESCLSSHICCTNLFIIISLTVLYPSFFPVSECSPFIPVSASAHCLQQNGDVQLDAFGQKELCKSSGTGSQKKQSYVSQSAVALRCRVMPPPCIKNLYLNTDSSVDQDIFGDMRPRPIGKKSLTKDYPRFCSWYYLHLLVYPLTYCME